MRHDELCHSPGAGRMHSIYEVSLIFKQVVCHYDES